MSRIKLLTDVVDWRLCIGCGACAYICPEDKVELWDFHKEGIRPVLKDTRCGSCRDCLDVCPSVGTDFGLLSRGAADGGLGDKAFKQDWGQVLEIWEGHASDPEIRFKGSSGGVITAISAYCLEKGGMHGALHIAQHPDDPVRNQTRMSRNRQDLIAATGSRYSPASVCDSLDLVENAPAPCVVIGKPGEMAALRKAQQLRPKLDARVGVALSFFCAESPSTYGTVSLIQKLGVPPAEVADLRYRGLGWPGHFAPVCKGESEPRAKLPYKDSWKFLQSFRPWSAHMWPDGTGELADISCGDPWYEKPDGENPGFSLLAVRTQRGREIIQAAQAAGYLTLTRAEPWKLVKSQQYLANKKASTWGRLSALRWFLLPTPKFRDAHLFGCWLRQPFKEKLRSLFGTAQRVWTRKLYRRLQLDRSGAVPAGKPRQP